MPFVSWLLLPPILNLLILAKSLDLGALDRVGYTQLHYVVFLSKLNRVEKKALVHCSTPLWKVRDRLRDIYMFKKSEHTNLMIDGLVLLSQMLFAPSFYSRLCSDMGSARSHIKPLV